MRALLLIAHGSRKAYANDEVRRLAERVEALEGNDFGLVVTAFLEFGEPDILRGVDRCVDFGAAEIVVVPYFLAAGNHVVRDLPRELECAGARHPRVRIGIAAHVGGADALAGLVLQCAQEEPSRTR